MRVMVVGAVAAVLVLLAAWMSQRLPTCRAVFFRETDVVGQWVQSHRAEVPWEAPAWAREVREIRCRDGAVYVWQGDPPTNTIWDASQRGT